MAGKPGLSSDHDKIANLCAAGNPNLSGHDATPAKNDIVPDLHQIIDHRARTDHGVVSGAAIDRRVGADIDIIADDHPPELRDLDRPPGVRREPESGLADAHTGMQHDARADHAMAERHIGVDPTIVADFDPDADHRVGPDLAARAEPSPRLDHHIV